MNGTVVTRAKRKLFYGVPASGGSGDPTYTRMNGFSTLTESKNPKEHTVQYVDMEMEVTTTTGVSSSYDFTFERLDPNTVHNDMTGIIDSEKIGDDAVRTFISVDFTNKNSDGTYPAVKRDYLIVGRDGGRKKLTRCMIDDKFPKETRDQVPLIADDGEILWIIGGRISERYKITSCTRNVLEITYQGGTRL